MKITQLANLHAAVIATATLLCACEGEVSVADRKEFAGIIGREICLVSDAYVLADNNFDPPYLQLSDSLSTILPTLAHLERGARLQVVDILHRTSFEHSLVHPMIAVPGVGKPVSATTLFDIGWLMQALRAVDGAAAAPSLPVRGALDPEMAVWCANDRERSGRGPNSA